MAWSNASSIGKNALDSIIRRFTSLNWLQAAQILTGRESEVKRKRYRLESSAHCDTPYVIGQCVTFQTACFKWIFLSTPREDSSFFFPTRPKRNLTLQNLRRCAKIKPKDSLLSADFKSHCHKQIKRLESISEENIFFNILQNTALPLIELRPPKIPIL